MGQGIIGIFLEPVTTDLGWSVWQYTLGPSLALGIGAFAGITVGQIVDQRGPRLLIGIGAMVCALCFWGLARQSQLWIYWVLNIVAGVAGWNLFGPLTINATLTKWFVANRGWALAIGSIGVSLASLITPIAMTSVVDSVGWRMGYLVLAAIVLAAVVPITLVMRRTPEDMGLLPDGALTGTHQSKDEKKEAVSFTRAEALRTRSFWLLVIGFGLNTAALFSVWVHAIPFATAAGFTRTTAALAVTINGLGNLLSKAVWGYTLQRFDPRWLIITAYSISATGVGLMLLAAWQGQAWLLFPAFFLYGFGFGGTIPLGEFIWASYFGRAHIGAIRGVGQLLTIAGPTFGPVLVGLWFDLAGTYGPAFVTIIGVYLTAALFIWMSRKPQSQGR